MKIWVLRTAILHLLVAIQMNNLIAQNSTISYLQSNDDIANPERRFMHYTITEASNYNLLDSAYLANLRNSYQSFQANYSVKVTTIFRYFVLDLFKNQPITNSFLQNLDADFNTCRKAGVKMVIRFSYVNSYHSNGCNSWICPPYGDAPKSIVLQHIAQIKPYMTKHKDVLMAVQMGFIGIWGEQFYTDYFGDASQPPYGLSNTNWSDRIEVLDSLISIVPQDIQIQVRYPQMKQKTIYGLSAPTNSNPLTLPEAFGGAKKSRIGFHNDCFLANYDDYGTYANYSTGSSDTTNLKPYKALDSRYVMVGGETCDSTGLWGLCDPYGGNTIRDLARMHYTYINTDYNNLKVNNYWTNGGCIDEIKNKLGYRLHLTSGTYTNSVVSGGDFQYTLNIVNTGFASPVNRRVMQIVLINDISGEQWTAITNHDPRYWFTGSHVVTGSICLPSCILPGTYKLYLKLSDPSSRLENRPEYAIRLANQNVWNSTTGLNNLNHTVTVTSGSTLCNSPIKFESFNKWIGPNNGNWNAAVSNWSQGRFPTGCDKVVIGFDKEVFIQPSIQGFAQEIILQEGGNLKIKPGGMLHVEK